MRLLEDSSHQPASRRATATDAFLWSIVTLALVILSSWPNPGSALGVDSVVYLDIARNFREGLFGYTSLVHYDAERSFGTVPAPMVTFPLGYPAAIAATSSIVPGLPLAAFSVSAAAMVGIVVVLAALGRRIGLSRTATNVLLALVVLNQSMLVFAGSVMADALFTFTALAGVAAILVARRSVHDGPRVAWALAGVLIGLSYYVRYAGLFFVVGLFVLLVVRFVRHGLKALGSYGIAAACAALVVIPGMARNIVLVGTWRGGNEKPVHIPLGDVLYETARGLHGIVLGLSGYGPWRFVAVRVLLALLLCGLLLWLVIALFTRSSVHPGHSNWREDAHDLSIIGVSYWACLFYAGMTTVITYGARYFVPLVPLLALVFVLLSVHALWQRHVLGAGRRVLNGTIAVGLVTYAFLNLTGYAMFERRSSIPAMERIVDARDFQGRSGRQVALQLASEGRVLVANEGQVLGHVLGTPTVSLADPWWTAATWNEETIRNLLYTYRAAGLLILRPTTQAEYADLTDFQLQLSRGVAPYWMRMAFQSSSLAIYVPSGRDWLEAST